MTVTTVVIWGHRTPPPSRTPGSRWPTSARSWPGTGPRWPWVVAGLGIVQLLPPFPGVPWGRHALGVPLIVLGAAVSVTSYLEWQRNQAALRRGDPLPRSVLPRVLAGTIAGIAALSAAVLLTSAAR